MMIVVRPLIRRSSACWINISVSVSTEDVASSRIRMGCPLKLPGQWRALFLPA
jgi:hypothetical protein